MIVFIAGTKNDSESVLHYEVYQLLTVGSGDTDCGRPTRIPNAFGESLLTDVLIDAV
ncbi:hypothetical protein [Aureliella helgolandensis]|uniref:hypothetical protein n=1 Tax=Aureliella helgolandensis TaxID=2527968 RepID=UPI0018D1285B|nr:hypothetical protein [Aureliella helgolandensis]